MRTHLIADEGVRRDRIHLCYNGLDARRFRRAVVPRPQQIPPTALVVGTLCALRPEKDLLTLVEAFAACHQRVPDLFLLVVGDGPERTRLELEISRRGLTERCYLQPTVPDVVPWLSLMDVFVLPSRFEALPNALMEAMACGCACIASRVGGTAELVQTGESGYLFEAGDAAALADHIMTLTGDAALRRRFGERATTRIATEFSLERAASRLSQLYDELLEARTRAVTH
jgi:glycosyltransferase involved in cell wall biosynthesis